MYGVHFLTVGRFSVERKRLELRPEEALYLAERGTIELWWETRGEEGEVLRVPMSVQQAWASLLGHDELTMERFQVRSFSFWGRGKGRGADGCVGGRSTRTSSGWDTSLLDRE